MKALALTALLVAPVLLSGGATGETAGFGQGEFVVAGCEHAEDRVSFTMTETSANTWRFVLLDNNTDAECAFVTAEVLTATGSPATGFTGDLVSRPWSVDANGEFETLPMSFFLDPVLFPAFELNGTAEGRLFG